MPAKESWRAVKQATDIKLQQQKNHYTFLEMNCKYAVLLVLYLLEHVVLVVLYLLSSRCYGFVTFVLYGAIVKTNCTYNTWWYS